MVDTLEWISECVQLGHWLPWIIWVKLVVVWTQVMQLMEAVVNISENVYANESKRISRQILQLYNRCWLYHEPCLTLFSHLASWHQVFGLYFHALLIHSPITNLRSLNTEAHERMCSSIKCVARNCTNRKPAYAMLLRVHKHSKIAVLFEMLNNCPLQWYIFNPGLYMHAFQ